MRDAFGVERGDISKGLFQPAAVAAKNNFRAGFGANPVKRYLTTHFPRTTKAGRNQLRRVNANAASTRAARVEQSNKDLAAGRRHDAEMARWRASQ
jgi:hypothetical protein